uniref:Lipid transfer-like protein VAS n=1 Tax=Anthurium amnicola TaxID=1678845 RepID=A0A1D1Z5V1_9ARAE
MGKVFILYCVLVLSVLTSTSQAQDSSCLNQLIPCLDYTTSKKTPPSSCCDPLKSLIKSDPQCLCNMLNSKTLTRQAGINMTQAQWLPSRCGANVSPSSCSSLSSPKSRTPNSASKLSFAKTLLVAALLVVIQMTCV